MKNSIDNAAFGVQVVDAKLKMLQVLRWLSHGGATKIHGYKGAKSGEINEIIWDGPRNTTYIICVFF